MYALSYIFRNSIALFTGLGILTIGIYYFAVVKGDFFMFLLFAIPFLVYQFDRDRNLYSVFKWVFIAPALFGFIMLWPETVDSVITFVEPTVNSFIWWKGTLALLYGLVILGWGLRGNLKALLTWLLIVWFLVAFIEEIIFRGFLMMELKKLLGDKPGTPYLNLFLTSIVFGLAHWYQGPSGIVTTGIVGFLLGWIFMRYGFNLWLPILAHGFVDTIGLSMIYFNADLWLEKTF